MSLFSYNINAISDNYYYCSCCYYYYYYCCYYYYYYYLFNFGQSTKSHWVYLTGSVTKKQSIGILMELNPHHFRKIFFCFYEDQYMSLLICSDKIKARYFHPTTLFINDLFTINGSGELECLFVIYISTVTMLRF